MNNWNKYEVKDSSRRYWTIFFRPVNIDECKKNLNTTPGSEGYFSLDWSYFVYQGCTAPLEKMTEKEINKLYNREGIAHGVFSWEAHIDEVEKREKGEPYSAFLFAPTPEQFLKDYHNEVTNVLMAACAGDITEDSIDKQINKAIQKMEDRNKELETLKEIVHVFSKPSTDPRPTYRKEENQRNKDFVKNLQARIKELTK